MLTILRNVRGLPGGYTVIRFHEPAASYLRVYCHATGKYVGRDNARRGRYHNQRQAVTAAKRSARFVAWNLGARHQDVFSAA